MLSIKPLTEGIGAEVLGLDLKSGHDDATRAALNQALLDHIVLVIPGQDLSAPQYRESSRIFGEPMRQHREKFNLEECPDVGMVVNRGDSPPAVNWHTDHTNHEMPPKVTMLYAVTLPAHGGDTSFANMYAAYAALPPEKQAALASLHTVNHMEANDSYSDSDRERYPGGIRHPVVRTHPETGKQALYFHVSKSQGIDGMPAHEVRPFLEALIEESIRPHHVYRHRWRKGDVVICDNRCAMHRVNADYDPDDHRLLWRVILRGDRPH